MFLSYWLLCDSGKNEILIASNIYKWKPALTKPEGYWVKTSETLLFSITSTEISSIQTLVKQNFSDICFALLEPRKIHQLFLDQLFLRISFFVLNLIIIICEFMNEI